MSPAPTIRKASLGGLDCYMKGKDFLGSDYWLFLGIFFVGSFIGGLVPLVIVGAMWCGFAKCLLLKERGQPMDFNQLFDGFNYFVQGLVAVLLTVVAILAAIIPIVIVAIAGTFLSSMLGDAGFLVAIPLFLVVYACYIVVIGFFQICLLFSSCLIVERKMDGLEAFKASLSGIMQNLGGLLVVSLIGMVILFVGTILCIIPGLLAMPMIVAGHFICYRKIFPRSQASTGASPPVKPAMG